MNPKFISLFSLKIILSKKLIIKSTFFKGLLNLKQTKNTTSTKKQSKNMKIQRKEH